MSGSSDRHGRNGTRVFITGMGLASPLGHDLPTVTAALRESRHGIVTMPEWEQIPALTTRLAALARDVPLDRYPRKKARTMGRVALLSTYATEKALEDAGLDLATLPPSTVGLAYGSTHGSSSAQEEFCRSLFASGLQGIPSSQYLKFMSNTCAVNLAQFFGIRGRVMSTCSACTSASHAIGYGYEAIRAGHQDVMICGGAEEMHFSHAAIFDILYATSTHHNDAPAASPRPFDKRRDGLVVGEGAGTLVLESEAHAKARGARVYGEILGFGTSCDGQHVTMPSSEGMAAAMRQALADAAVTPEQVDYVNAHATATEAGDIAESVATFQVLGDRVPVSSTKGHTGHTLGACGAIESTFCLLAAREGFVPETRNLEEPDPRCAPLDYVRGSPRQVARLDILMNNNFAFGGINTSLVFRRF